MATRLFLSKGAAEQPEWFSAANVGSKPLHGALDCIAFYRLHRWWIIINYTISTIILGLIHYNGMILSYLLPSTTTNEVFPLFFTFFITQNKNYPFLLFWYYVLVTTLSYVKIIHYLNVILYDLYMLILYLYLKYSIIK